MKKGCAYCEAMHLNQCPDAFSKVSQYCGKFDHEEMPQRAYIYAVDFDGTLAISFGDPKEYYIIEDSLFEDLFKSREALRAIIDGLGGLDDPPISEDLPNLTASGIRTLIRRFYSE